MGRRRQADVRGLVTVAGQVIVFVLQLDDLDRASALLGVGFGRVGSPAGMSEVEEECPVT